MHSEDRERELEQLLDDRARALATLQAKMETALEVNERKLVLLVSLVQGSSLLVFIVNLNYMSYHRLNGLGQQLAQAQSTAALHEAAAAERNRDLEFELIEMQGRLRTLQLEKVYVQKQLSKTVDLQSRLFAVEQENLDLVHEKQALQQDLYRVLSAQLTEIYSKRLTESFFYVLPHL